MSTKQLNLFSSNELETAARPALPEPTYEYHLYIKHEGERHYLRNVHYSPARGRKWDWLTDNEAGRRQRKSYANYSVALNQAIRWQRRAKSAYLVQIERVNTGG